MKLLPRRKLQTQKKITAESYSAEGISGAISGAAFGLLFFGVGALPGAIFGHLLEERQKLRRQLYKALKEGQEAAQLAEIEKAVRENQEKILEKAKAEDAKAAT